VRYAAKAGVHEVLLKIDTAHWKKKADCPATTKQLQVREL